MKSTLQKSFVVSLLFATAAVFSSTALAEENHSKIEKELIRIEKAMCEATLKNDAVAMAKFWTDDYVEVDTNGNIGTKQQGLDFTKNVKATVCENSKMTVRVHGNMAILVGNGKFKSDLYNGDLTFTDVYVKKNNAWLLVTYHWSEIKPPKK